MAGLGRGQAAHSPMTHCSYDCLTMGVRSAGAGGMEPGGGEAGSAGSGMALRESMLWRDARALSRRDPGSDRMGAMVPRGSVAGGAARRSRSVCSCISISAIHFFFVAWDLAANTCSTSLEPLRPFSIQ
jgi:hypothetical protein